MTIYSWLPNDFLNFCGPQARVLLRRRVADSCTPSARQMTQGLVNHEPILNTIIRYSDNNPGRAVLIGPTEPAAHNHCRLGALEVCSSQGLIQIARADGTVLTVVPDQ